MTGDPKERQISFKVERDYYDQTKDLADEEEITVADFSRKLHRHDFGASSQIWLSESHVDAELESKKGKKAS